jgi:putative membrane-bound dehydrogenase-like protein
MSWSSKHACRSAVGLFVGILGIALAARGETPEPPVSPDGAVKVALFAAEPEINTPIGTTVDTHGRLLIIESNTHFRPKDYKGAASDRILVLQDTNNSGHADKITTFFEGMKYLMNLVADPDGSILVSSRNEIFRLRDPGNTGASTEKITLATLETKMDYPHNGLHGLAIDRDRNVYFGIGENFGGPWTLVGTDGRKLTGEVGSGCIFKVDSKGRGLTLIARGFWNPFGMGIDPLGDVWTVDNDPDGRPPCRLINVLQGGDYGFEMRFGRTGLHPLQAWDAELPGTLGMVTGVGEAPCAVHWNRGKLLVSSWRDHQVEAYSLTPRGASFSATMEPLLKGTETFRPVGIAVAPDGALFITDWGSGSYTLNGKGRVWKVTFNSPAPTAEDLKKNSAMERAESLRHSQNVTELLAAMDDGDSATAQAAQFGLSQLPQTEKLEWSAVKTPRQHIGLMTSLLWRGTSVEPLIGDALKDTDDRVRQMAVRAITEQGIKSSRDKLQQMLGGEAMSPRLLSMTIAAINLLDGDPTAKVDSTKINGVLLSRMNAPEATDATKAVALRMLQAGHPHIALDQIRTLMQSPSQPLEIEAVRYLSADADPARFAALAAVVSDGKYETSVRAEAILGLSDDAANHVDQLLQFATGPDATLRHEALRSLRPLIATLTAPQKEQLADVARKYPEDTDMVQRLIGQPPSERPAETDMAGWQKIVDSGTGDPEAGRRIFFHPAGPGCFKCHEIEGRGRLIGPDLTMIGYSQTREHVLESILDPSREIAPLFTMWSITTKTGERIDGMLLRRDGQSVEVYVDATGKETKVKEQTVADRKMRKESLMPAGLVQAMTNQELRDVLAFLTEKR